MRSFDFYDTLVTRLVASPADIFLLVGERLNIPEFRKMRIAAEVRARDVLRGEITFEHIYDHILLPSELKEMARSLELEFERSLIAPVTAVLSQFQNGDLIISDMYHDEHLYREVLKRFLPSIVPGAVLISGKTGVNKATGGLWKNVAASYPAHQAHIGDNMSADVQQARKKGLVANHFPGSRLNRYEATMAKDGGDGSIIAGASRATRLSLTRSDSSSAEAATIEVFSSVIGPVLYTFAHWIMRTCDEERIRNVYFLARDGQLPFKICSKLVAESGQDLRCNYIFASRQALHLPGCKSIEDAETWLLDNTSHLTLRIIAERACVPLDVVVTASKGRIAVGPENNIPLGERRMLSGVIRDPLFIEAFTSSVNRAFESAGTYYRAQGLDGGEDLALVDVGWNGRLQRSLGTLLEKTGRRPARILGLYLCLSRRLSTAPGDDLRGLFANPECPDQVAFYDRYRHVFEAALSADHPTTRGFELLDGVARPVLGELYPAITEKKIALQHSTLDVFIENLIKVSRAAGRAIRPSTELVVENFKLFLSRPTRVDGHAFEGFLFVDGQAGSETNPITRIIRTLDLLGPARDFGFWREGTLSASGFRGITSVRQFIRRLLRKIPSRLTV